jgi:hypothetical protein
VADADVVVGLEFMGRAGYVCAEHHEDVGAG